MIPTLTIDYPFGSNTNELIYVTPHPSLPEGVKKLGWRWGDVTLFISFVLGRFVITYQDHDYFGKTAIFYPAIVWKGEGGVKKK
jgi:hypothetical protein